MADKKQGKPNSVKEALGGMGELSAADRAALEEGQAGAGAAPEGTEAAEGGAGEPEGSNGQPQPAEGVPEWAVLPPGLVYPKTRSVAFLRFHAKWTDTPGKGERQCIVWNLTVGDEKLALARTRGDHMRSLTECSKQMIRAVDGERVDWTRGAQANVEQFWDEIGHACRQMIQNYYIKTHTLTDEDTIDFFANCIAVRTAT